MGVGEEHMYVCMCMTLRAYMYLIRVQCYVTFGSHKLHSGVSPESPQAALRAPYDD